MMAALTGAWRRWRRSLLTGARVAAARLRFFLLLGAVLLVVAAWPLLRNVWDQLTGPAGLDAGVSPDTEYWCPMCPGVASDWPGKCPVCHMALVVRQKGEMTPLPDGAVARMQFSPYRVQLAGVHTSPVEFRPLVREVTLAGLLEPASANADDLTRLVLATDVFECDAGLFTVGQGAEVASEAFPGQAFPAQVTWLAPQVSPTARSLGVRLEIANPRQELRPGMFVAARVRVPLANLAVSHQLALEAWRNRTAASLCDASLASPLGTVPGGGLDALLEAAVRHAALHQGLLLAIPASAVIDTGTRKVVFLEQAPGLFDAVEVWLGRRCGDFYPVLAGLKPGQSVVTAGAFLLDAETRLNPAAAASYFGAGSRGGSSSATPTAPVASSELSAEDERLVKRQKVCPVTDQPLGSMGTPVRVAVEGRTVFLCCEGCAPALKKNPGKYLAKVPK
jgi:hypothetical protein